MSINIPYGRQNINQSDIDSVIDVLKSDWLTQGPSVDAFEKTSIKHNGALFACAVNSATSALHIACKSLRVGHGDILWTVPNTFVASANCGLYCGASVDFVDIDSNTFNMCPNKLEDKLKLAAISNKIPKVVVPVHFGGASCDMKSIHELSIKYGFKIIEDASHAVGGKFLDSPVGSCKYSDITVLSFHPVKIITTAEGGMALTNDKELAERMSLFRSHGITRDAAKMIDNSDGPWFYQQIELGLNYRMTDIQAALGASQYKRLDHFVIKRNEIAKRYIDNIGDMPIAHQSLTSSVYSAYHLFVIKLQKKSLRKKIFNYLRNAGIGVNVHYIPVHTHPYYKNMGFDWGDFPESENYYHSAVSLPMYPDLDNEKQDFVIKTLNDAFKL